MTPVYPEHFEEKTGFDRIREMLSAHCFSILGQREIGRIRFETGLERIQCLQQQTEEFRQILLRGESFPGSGYYDPSGVFSTLRIEQTFAEAGVLLDIGRSVDTILRIISFLSGTNDRGELRYPWLARLTVNLEVDNTIPGRIDALVDEKAVVRDTASPELAAIRQKKADTAALAKKRILQLLSEGKSQGWIQQDAELALRNGRQLIPLTVAYKRKLRGFVHDHSATGQTAYVEPEEVFELNNRLRDLDAEERREIVRLLREFADWLRPAIPNLEKAYVMLGHMDAFRAKARLALELGASMPRLTAAPLIRWVNARHPLLYLSHKAQDKHVEPLSISLDRDNRILVISGPNAGGKSVCLKTFGLLQYMLQCGLPVPMESHSEAGIFSQLFIDIGDEQSLDNDLSTYSSHLLNMKYCLERMDKASLFLIDEFGSGTEPRIGGAIAQAILEQLNRRKAFGVVTTHYANLKLMAGSHPGILNGSMLFDTERMKPLFRLKTGTPGSSFAFEIARTIGLPESLLENAASLTGQQELDFDIQLQDLEVKKARLEDKEKQLRQADDFLAEMIEKYERLGGELSDRKNEILIQARKEAKDILSGANKIIENTIREIRESGADREKTKTVRRKLEDYAGAQSQALDSTPLPAIRVRGKKKKKPVPKAEPDPTPIFPGDPVRMKGGETAGEVIRIEGNKALVLFGNMQARMKLDDLEKLKKSSLAPLPAGRPVSRLSFDINEKAAAFHPELDLRGQKANEALKKLQLYIDDAMLLGIHQVRILHGKGDGILRQAIRETLKDLPGISRFRDEHPDRGGAGMTIVDFRM